jgi:hypothetical protein
VFLTICTGGGAVRPEEDIAMRQHAVLSHTEVRFLCVQQAHIFRYHIQLIRHGDIAAAAA